MERLLKTEVTRRTDEIKQLLLTGKSFEKPLARLYQDLRLQAKHTWIIQTYRFLLLYANEKQAVRLLHPALLQAFLMTDDTRNAHQIAGGLLAKYAEDPETKKLIKSLQSRQETVLPPYTALTSLISKDIQKAPHKKPKQTTLPVKWKEQFNRLNADTLQELGYYPKYKKLDRAPRPYRQILQANFDELFICYILQLDRSVVGLAGALLEMLLALHLEWKYQIKKVTLGSQHKKIFDLSLHELLQFYQQEQLLPPKILHLCHAARAQRNFIHPGKEIIENNRLTPSGRQICFLAVMEVIEELL